MVDCYLFVLGSVSQSVLERIRYEVLPENAWPGGEYSITTDEFNMYLTSTWGQELIKSVDMSVFFARLCNFPLEKLRVLVVEGGIYETLCGNNMHVVAAMFPMCEAIYIASPRYNSELFEKVK